MRYPASEKAEIIQLVEQSHLPAKRTLDKLGIPRATFYRWYDRYREGGPEALADHRSRPDRVWNRIPDDVRRQIIALALEVPELSPRGLAVRFTDCPSSDDLRLVRRFVKGGSGSSGLEFKRPATDAASV